MIKVKEEINYNLLLQAKLNLASNYRDLQQYEEALIIYNELEIEYKNKENLAEANIFNDIALLEKNRMNFAKVTSIILHILRLKYIIRRVKESKKQFCHQITLSYLIYITISASSTQ